MDRVFIDSSVLIAAALRENSHLAGNLARTDVGFLVSPYVLWEAQNNLPERGQRIRLVQITNGIEQVRGTLAGFATNINLPEKDIPVMLGAIKGKATHLITLDKSHFGPYFGQTVDGICIVQAVDYFVSLGPE